MNKVRKQKYTVNIFCVDVSLSSVNAGSIAFKRTIITEKR